MFGFTGDEVTLFRCRLGLVGVGLGWLRLVGVVKHQHVLLAPLL